MENSVNNCIRVTCRVSNYKLIRSEEWIIRSPRIPLQHKFL